jgi:hypothetical protein
MACTKRFAHDIFISYAHDDTASEPEGEKGWVERFERQLSIRLLKRFGDPVDVWCDPELSRAQIFDQVIERAIQGAAIIIPLLTNRWPKSEYCRQEIKWFCTHAQQARIGLTVDDYLRPFPVLLYNIPPEDRPDARRVTSAFMFHGATGDEYGKPLDPDRAAGPERRRAARVGGATDSRPFAAPLGANRRAYAGRACESRTPVRPRFLCT